MFQIKDFASIAAGSINWMKASTKKVSDFNVGGIVRSMLEAVAAEIDELYQQMFIGLREAIAVAVYNTFNFLKVQAVTASGLVRVTVTSSSSPVVVQAGTTFSTPGSQVTYVATADTTIAATNTYADVPVVASVTGIAGNLPASQTFTLAPPPANFVSATNINAFVNGVDDELDDARKTRFNAFIASLNRGTIAALMYGMKTTALTDSSGNIIERVVAAAVVEPYVTDNTQPVALVNCYVHNGSGSTSAALVTKANQVLYGYTDTLGNKIPGWKAAGVNVTMAAATETTLAVTAVLTAAAGYDHAALVTSATAAIAAYIRGLDIGQSALRAKIVQMVMDITGVANFVVSAPAGDTAAAANVKLMPGTITIT